ncbi:MAG: prepilin-type N-terminal cleavage/methylation domain-containing protein [Deltaproteobacteria bacterium]|nr:prepilin-type N-terminal cleavage/methylation domain-containing protein [Deltaproteobacteria bacterium]
MKKLLKSKGFTLIELMIVVAIIGILAAIAIPNFIRYQLKSKTTECKTVLGGVKTSQESFRAEIDNYANITDTQPGVLPNTVKTDWNQTGFVCNTACDRTATSNNCTRFDCIGYSPTGQVYYQYRSPHRAAAGTTTAEFAAGCQADLDGDGNEGSFSYQSSNETASTVGVLADGLSGCAAGIEAGFVTDCNPGQY